MHHYSIECHIVMRNATGTDPITWDMVASFCHKARFLTAQIVEGKG